MTFENYLMDEVWDSGFVLDDNFREAFETWQTELDIQELMDYADAYGRLEYRRGIRDITNTAEKLITDSIK